jgi:ATP-dependent DNA helicase RecG
LDLRKEVRDSLLKILSDKHGITPSSEINKSGEETIDATSPFESTQTELTPEDLDLVISKIWLEKTSDIKSDSLNKENILNQMHTRGFLWIDHETGKYHALAAGVLFLAKKPSICFPQCRIMADAYQGKETDPHPNDQKTITGPAQTVIEDALNFVKRNTRHPARVVGMSRIILNEYPEEAVREAIVNAIAHRDYDDSSRQIMLEVFTDKIIIDSPGAPPIPVTISKI